MALLLILVIGIFCGLEVNAEPCVPRMYNSTSIVCVCNATYCDFLDPIDESSISGGSFIRYISTKAGKRLQPESGKFSTAADGTAPVKLAIDTSKVYQDIYGFGGAVTDSFAYNFYNLSQETSDVLVRTYFGKGGANYNFMRYPLGSSDLGLSEYTYDNTPEPDLNLEHFALNVADTELRIPLVKRINKTTGGNLQLFVTPWFAPGWMRNTSAKGYRPIAVQYYQVWADYFVKFLDEYGDRNVTFWGISPQNEPHDTWTVTWSSDELAYWLGEYLGPTLEKAGYRYLKMMIMDDNRNHLMDTVNTTFKKAAADKYSDGVAIHWYTDRTTSPELLTQSHELYPDKFLFYTEACDLTGPITNEKNGDWIMGENYATSMTEAFNRWVVGWADWNSVLNTDGGPRYKTGMTAAIIANITSDEFYKQPIYYVQAHFSMFVLPGSKHVQLDSNNVDGLLSVAFVTPEGQRVIVLTNRLDIAVPVTIHDPEKGYISVTMEERSISTIIYT